MVWCCVGGGGVNDQVVLGRSEVCLYFTYQSSISTSIDSPPLSVFFNISINQSISTSIVCLFKLKFRLARRHSD